MLKTISGFAFFQEENQTLFMICYYNVNFPNSFNDLNSLKVPIFDLLLL